MVIKRKPFNDRCKLQQLVDTKPCDGYKGKTYNTSTLACLLQQVVMRGAMVIGKKHEYSLPYYSKKLSAKHIIINNHPHFESNKINST